MKHLLLGVALVSTGTVIGALSSDNTNGLANAQFATPGGQSGDALWHLPRFGKQGWLPTITTCANVNITSDFSG